MDMKSISRTINFTLIFNVPLLIVHLHHLGTAMEPTQADRESSETTPNYRSIAPASITHDKYLLVDQLQVQISRRSFTMASYPVSTI
jgi:hypothetical protein